MLQYKTGGCHTKLKIELQKKKSPFSRTAYYPFRDIFSAIADGPTCTLLQGILSETVRKKFQGIDAVVGLESRGFLFAFSLAAELGVSCLPVRKKGKLPGEVMSYKYDLEYGSVSFKSV